MSTPQRGPAIADRDRLAATATRLGARAGVRFTTAGGSLAPVATWVDADDPIDGGRLVGLVLSAHPRLGGARGAPAISRAGTLDGGYVIGFCGGSMAPTEFEAYLFTTPPGRDLAARWQAARAA